MKLNFWKKLPVWIKGGIIGAIVAIMGLLLSFAIAPFAGNSSDFVRTIFTILVIPFQVISILFTLGGVFGCNFKADPCYAEMFTGHIITGSMFFGIGAYLSWMKSKKKLKYGILSLILSVVLFVAILLIAIH